MRRWLLLLMLWPLLVRAAVSLPRIDLTAAPPPLRAAVTGLLDDYVQRLPDQPSLTRWQEPGGLWHSWSAHREALLALCTSDAASCALVMPKQYDRLMTSWLALRDDTDYTLQHAITLSALIDLCDISWSWGGAGGYRCLPRELRMLAAQASSAWNSLGYQHLFIAFLQHEIAQRRQLESWIEEDRSLSSQQRTAALAALAPIDLLKMAKSDELSGDPQAALLGWNMVLIQLLAQGGKPAHQLLAMDNLASLATRLGRLERAEQWLAFAGETLAAGPALPQAACALRATQLSLDIARGRSAAAALPALARLQALIAQDCPFTLQAQQLALAHLARADTTQASAVLALAVHACDQSAGCGYTRRLQLTQLQQVAQTDLAGLRRAAAFWGQRFQSSDNASLLASEIDIAWALAERLQAQGAPAEALALLADLERQVSHLRSLRIAAASLARYDDLIRSRAKLTVLSGVAPMPVDAAEALRSQRLLLQLQLARWEHHLAGVDDAAAKAELQTMRNNVAALRSSVAALPAAIPPALRLLLQDATELLAQQDSMFFETYLRKLALKQAAPDASARFAAQTLNGSDRPDYAASWAENKGLARSDAYLSWLRVPGGYIGTLLAFPVRADAAVAARGVAQVSQQFIPFSAQDDAILRLYRDLLMAGAGMQRGIRLSAPLDTERDGLMLAQQPLWQLPDGSLHAGPALPGARRVREFAVLSDLLYRKLLAPFAAQYQQAERLIISPDGALAYLPFETLTYQGVSILESIDIGYVQSLDIWSELNKRAAARRPAQAARLLSVADPAYGVTTAPVWPPLPGTRTESDALSKLFARPLQLMGAAASKATLDGLNRNGELRQFQVLHFATHGYVDDQRSALVMSPGGKDSSLYLTDTDILDWQLESDLTLLSACNTGLGREQQGEGIVGLPYAFFMAGNINTLMSLWPVDDAGTAALIPAYLQRLQRGEDSVTALSNTKRAFARGDYGPLLRNPRIWSAFVLYGVPLTMPAARH